MVEREQSVVYVWDPLVRIGHWTIVSTFTICYLTEDDLLSLHVWSGYLLGAVLVLRILWGLVGTRHARFRDFLYRPATVARYLRDLVSLQSKRYIGHTPAGGVMIVLLLISLAATTWTGLMVYALEENAGPLASMVAERPARPGGVAGVPAARANHDKEAQTAGEGSDPEKIWEERHEFFANLTLVLVFLHVAGVLLASYAHRENLVKAMFTGWKRRES